MVPMDHFERSTKIPLTYQSVFVKGMIVENAKSNKMVDHEFSHVSRFEFLQKENVEGSGNLKGA